MDAAPGIYKMASTMKTNIKNQIAVMLACAVVLAGGCATENGGDNSQQSQSKQSDKKPEVGMTKEEIIGMYGKTENIQSSSDGETWIYNMNMGEAFIPFNFGYRPKTRIITFGPDGKVTRWNYSN
jgi:hypothetical protein